MNQLTTNTQVLLKLAKSADGPSAQTRQRIGHTLTRTVSAGAITLGATAAEAAMSVNAPVGLLTLLTSGKIGGLVATTVGFGIGGLFIAITSPPRQVEISPPQGTPADSTTSVRHAAGSGVTAIAPDPAPTVRVLSPAIAATSGLLAASHGAPKNQVGEETRLLALVQQALRVGDGHQAMGLLGRYRHEFPQGALVEEALAAEVFARCAIGDFSGAERAGARFVRSYPNSPMLPKVESSCGTNAQADETE